MTNSIDMEFVIELNKIIMTLRQRWRQFIRNILGLKKSEEKEIKYHEVIERETELLKRRRKILELEEPEEVEDNKFGIALSGGGIRSATINLGFLKTLNEFNLLKRADYISTVSGGGYTGAYVQATLKEIDGNYEELFNETHIDHLRNTGEYMIPGTGITKFINRLVLVVGFMISLLMSWLSPFIIGMMGYLVFLLIDRFALDRDGFEEVAGFLFNVIVPIGAALLFAHFILNVLMSYDLKVSNFFNRVETYALLFLGVIFLGVFATNLNSENFIGYGEVSYYLMVIFALFVLGYFSNPNALSFHRFYRNQLANAFLNNVKNPNVLLQNLLEKSENEKDNYIHAPYPLINTCLNLLSTEQEEQKQKKVMNDNSGEEIEEQNFNFAGAKTNDYFLLSPLFCGSKLTGYVSTDDTYNYRDLTLPAAATISAAAVNPGMGVYSNKILGILTTVFNARLGYWILNPKKTKLYDSLIWWPRYFVYELFGMIGIKNEMLNISDGGHIENLGIYELLRRKCKLIIAVDAGADPQFSFSELQNVAIRARNELGMEIRFPTDYLEEEIRPKPSVGYSKRRFGVADICYLWEEVLLRDEEEKVILDKNGKPIEILINYKYYDSNPDIEDAVSDILIAVEEQIKGKLSEEQTKNALQKIKEKVTDRLDADLKIGTLVYVKSSITAPLGKPSISKETDPLKYYTYKYKIYHPDFPHESTADQFFDPVQWTAYYELGRFICADVLGIDSLDSFLRDFKKEFRPNVNINELKNRRFGRRVKIFEEYKQLWEEEQDEIKNQEEEEEMSEVPMARSTASPSTMRELEERLDSSLSANEESVESIDVIEDVPAPDSIKIVVGKNDEYTM